MPFVAGLWVAAKPLARAKAERIHPLLVGSGAGINTGLPDEALMTESDTIITTEGDDTITTG